jgi:hypothetical protein
MQATLRAALALVAMVLGADAAHADCADPLRDPDDVLGFHVRLSRADWDALVFDDVVGDGCDEQYPYHQVEFRCGDDEPWIAIGARHKRGDQRGRDTDQKPPLKLDFNRVVQGQRWPAALGDGGFRKLSLNTGLPDNPGGILSALVTEHYGWRLIHAEVPTSGRSAYARLYVHFTDDDSVEYHGLYIVIEDIDRTAIRARYPGDTGTLVKTTTGSCRDQVVYDDGAPNGAADGIDEWLALNPDDFPGVWAERTDEALDLEEVLRHEAIRDILAAGNDTILSDNESNYYAFDPRVGRRHYLPWDLDDIFRVFPQIVDPDTQLDDTCSPIGQRTRCHPEIRPRYLEIACQLINGTLATDKLLAEIAALDGLVRPIAMEEDELVWPDHDPFDPSVEGTYAWQIDRLESWIPDRIDFVRSAIEAEGVSCPVGCDGGETEACSYLACAGERRCEDGRWTTCLVEPETDDPGNGLDDDCDGLTDEAAGGGGGDDGGPGPGPDGADGGDGDGADGDGGPGATDGPTISSGCGCRSAHAGAPRSGALTAFALGLALLLARARRRG